MTITSLNIADGTVGRTRIPKLKKRYVILTALVVILLASVILAYHFGLFSPKEEEETLSPPNPRKALPPSISIYHTFKKAAVCADGPPCAQIGRTILQNGGSAVDAAIAALFCNGMVTMQSMGLGGGSLMTIYIRQTRTAYTLNARETAPGKAKPELYKNDPLTSQNGPLSIAVPGELKGYWTAHQRFGKLKWAELIKPTLDLCHKGYQMTQHQYESLFRAKLHNDTNLNEWFKHPNGTFKAAGSIIHPKKFCKTLEMISEKGGDDFYTGDLSKLIIKDLKAVGSLITKEDLANYTAQWLEPIQIDLRNKDRLYSFPPPGSGVLLGFIMQILDGFKFNPHSIDGVENTVNTYHKMVEAFKYAYAKRTELGDTSFVNITELIKNLTSTTYADTIRQKIKDNSTSSNPKDYGAVYYDTEDHGTAHISVLAENGDAVSVTSSVNIYFGAGLTSEETGIIFNSAMDDFSFPYFKNYFNLPGSPNNALMPGKRSLSSMSPTIVVDEKGDVKLVVGASGGTKITAAVAQVIMRMLWFGQNIKEAVDAPRIYHQLYPMEVEYEYGTLQQVVDGLKSMGHKAVRLSNASSIVCAIFKNSEQLYANADYRKGGDVYGLN